jgi:hypothetical protein
MVTAKFEVPLSQGNFSTNPGNFIKIFQANFFNCKKVEIFKESVLNFQTNHNSLMPIAPNLLQGKIKWEFF